MIELYDHYLNVHSKYADGCKRSCGVMKLIEEYGNYEIDNHMKPVYKIIFGGYCLGLNRLSETEYYNTKEEAINAAYKMIKKVRKDESKR